MLAEIHAKNEKRAMANTTNMMPAAGEGSSGAGGEQQPSPKKAREGRRMASPHSPLGLPSPRSQAMPGPAPFLLTDISVVIVHRRVQAKADAKALDRKKSLKRL